MDSTCSGLRTSTPYDIEAWTDYLIEQAIREHDIRKATEIMDDVTGHESPHQTPSTITGYSIPDCVGPVTYRIRPPLPEGARTSVAMGRGSEIRFEHAGEIGCRMEDLLAICAHRLEAFQGSPHKCAENATALDSVRDALAALHARTARTARVRNPIPSPEDHA